MGAHFRFGLELNKTQISKGLIGRKVAPLAVKRIYLHYASRIRYSKGHWESAIV